MPGRVRARSAPAASSSFITGNGFAERCRFVLDAEGFAVNEEAENENWWFCKADFLEYFFEELAPDAEFVLFSHNSDRPIDARFRRHLRRRNLVAWFAANAALVHPKLVACPLGIANPEWPHGDTTAIEAVQRADVAKERLFDVSFTVNTNRAERERCLAETGLELEAPRSFAEYLDRLAASQFCISPRGNGIDTHRTWEALYVRTIPVVTRSVLTDHHPDLPLVVLDNWSEFRSIDFGPELYERTWDDWNPDKLRLDRYLERVSRTVDRLRGDDDARPAGPG